MKKLTTEQWIQQAKELHGDKFGYTNTVYSTAKAKLIIECPEHGPQEMLPQHHLKGYGCGVCGKKQINISNGRQLTQEQFLDRVKDIPGLTFTNTFYKTKREKIVVTCNIHGDYTTTAEVLLKGCGCPKCKSSKGEDKIETWLLTKGINFEIQKDFQGCFYNKQLKFDFYLPDHNMCIEYDGEQHFKSIEYWGGVQGYQKRIIKDSIKDGYCRGNNIVMLRIAYNQNVEEVLEQYFNN
jgi:Zn finger protein HypA/HybF involved in hydrogenase expression